MCSGTSRLQKISLYKSLVRRICFFAGWVAAIVTPSIGLADNGLSPVELRKFTQQFCIRCHDGSEQAESEFEFPAVAFEEPLARGPIETSNASDDVEVDVSQLQQWVDVLENMEMPPESESQPSKELRQDVIQHIRTKLASAIAKGDAHIRTPIRRMNRFQYNNAVVDLFQLDCIVFTLPERAMREHKGYFKPEAGKMPDEVFVGNRPLGKSQMIEPRLAGVAAFPQDLRAEHGYDNQADHLSLSPLLMESFLKLGQSITSSPDFTPRHVGIWQEFFAEPATLTDVRPVVVRRLRKFLAKAFRRPAEPEIVDRYADFATARIQDGTAFPDAMKMIAAATIASPHFLYLYDKDLGDRETGQPIQVDDVELASRMSLFLWSSLPDETLLRLAASGTLSQPKKFDEQIDRMLLDPKIKRFCDSFPIQWLQLDRIVSSVPNRDHFDSFYFSKYRMSMHMMMEPLLLFETVLIEDRSILDLIDPDFSYRSAKLQNLYGELGASPVKGKGSDVTVLRFQRVPIEDRRTGGVITNAAVMTMTSGTERTKPITRGAWIAGVIFNDPPEPPPADVPPLAEKPDVHEQDLTLRERLSAHRERADCRGCHEQIDPLGFALENYDPIGLWRDEYENGRSIDASGTLFREHRFTNVVEFKDAVLREKNRFCRAFCQHLMSYALARELGPADQAAIDKIVRDVANDGYRMKTLIRGIIHSTPFRTKS